MIVSNDCDEELLEPSDFQGYSNGQANQKMVTTGLVQPANLQIITTGPVAITGPNGTVRRIQVSVQDTPESIEHCLRNVFGLRAGADVLILNRDDCAVPLGAGLLLQSGADGSGASGPIYRLDESLLNSTPRRPRHLSVGGEGSPMGPFTSEGRADRKNSTASEPASPFGGIAWGKSMSRWGNNANSLKPLTMSEAVVECKSSLTDDLSCYDPESPTHGAVSAAGAACTAGNTDKAEVPNVPTDTDETKTAQPSSFSTVLPSVVSGVTTIVSTHTSPETMLSRTISGDWCESSTLDEYKFLQTQTIADEMLMAEHRYWYQTAEGFRKKKHTGASLHMRRASVSSHCSTADSSAEEFLNVAVFDCSDMRIDLMFSSWTRGGKHSLTKKMLAKKLSQDHGVTISPEALDEGLDRIRKYLKVEGDDTSISKAVFGGFWQRLLIGAAFRRSYQKRGNCKEEAPMQLVEYSEHTFDCEVLTEEELLFRTPLRVKNQHRTSQVKPPDVVQDPARWVRTNSASPERLMRLGLKFYLHPLATGDAIAAGRNGMTKIDRHGHQYFVSLEVYTLDGEEQVYRSGSGFPKEDEPMKVGPNVSRYGMYLVATGNPMGKHRDWLLTMIGERNEGIQDPLDFFKADRIAAVNILDKVQSDLEVHGQLREYQADFLLYTVIDRGVAEFMPICLAYGHRLQWLQRRLKVMKLSLPDEYVDEVAKMQLEMQELKQWIGQVRGIVKTLAKDCRDTKDKSVESMPWNFGAHAQGRGKSIAMFLVKTEAHIDEMWDRLSTLDELARNFLEHHERHRDAFVNSILLTLTIATAVFMPAQLLAGIYGTNFVDKDGVPTIPELTWKYGYFFFVTISVLIIASGLCLAYICLRRR